MILHTAIRRCPDCSSVAAVGEACRWCGKGAATRPPTLEEAYRRARDREPKHFKDGKRVL